MSKASGFDSSVPPASMFEAKYTGGPLHGMDFCRRSNTDYCNKDGGATERDPSWHPLHSMSRTSSQEHAHFSTSLSSISSSYHVSATEASQNHCFEDGISQENLPACTDFLKCSSVCQAPHTLSRRASFSSSPKRPLEFDFLAPMEDSLENYNSDVDCTLSLGTTATLPDRDKAEAATRQSRSGSPLHPSFCAWRTSARMHANVRPDRGLDSRLDENFVAKKDHAVADSVTSKELTYTRGAQPCFLNDVQPMKVSHDWMGACRSGVICDPYPKAKLSEEPMQRAHLCVPYTTQYLRRQYSEQEATSALMLRNASFRYEKGDHHFANATNVCPVPSYDSPKNFNLFPFEGINHHAQNKDLPCSKASYLGVASPCLDGMDQSSQPVIPNGRSAFCIEKGSSDINWNSSTIDNGQRNMIRICAQCKTMKTPLWRNGPQGPKSLCNACGIRYKKEEKRSGGSNCIKNSAESSPTSSVLCYQGSSPASVKGVKEAGGFVDRSTSVDQQWPCSYLDVVGMLLGYKEGKLPGKKPKLTDDHIFTRNEDETSPVRWQDSNQRSAVFISPSLSMSSSDAGASQATERSVFARDFLSGWESTKVFNSKVANEDQEAGTVPMVARSCGLAKA